MALLSKALLLPVSNPRGRSSSVPRDVYRYPYMHCEGLPADEDSSSRRNVIFRVRNSQLNRKHLNSWWSNAKRNVDGDTTSNVFEMCDTVIYEADIKSTIYEGRLWSSWTELIIPSRNFVEVWWRSLFRSTSLGKRSTSYNAPPTSRKRVADRWSLRNFLPQSSIFMVENAQSIGRDLDCMADVLMGFHLSTFSKTNTEFNSDHAPCNFWASSTMKRELRVKKFRSDQQSGARFREVGGAL
jgi:hypothetical protein